MASNSFSLISLAIFGAILLSSQGLVEARGKVGVNPFCLHATNYGLCNIMVKGATTQKDAAINAIQATRALATQIPSLTAAVTDIINTGIESPEAKEQVIKQCTEVFTNTVNDLDNALVYAQDGDMFSAAVRLSAIEFSLCSDSMEEFGVTFPMLKIVTQFEREVSNSLAVVQFI